MSGRLTVVGLGPGAPEWCTPAVRERLLTATDLVGYDRYLAMVDAAAGCVVPARRHGSGNRVELDRARHALDLASAGADVVVVSSGDAGVFAMAAVVMEQIDTHPTRWVDVAVDVEPGITAAQAAAARAGAPLGHDYCVISLSDVRKPWPVVAARLDAAAGADFVLALYNPRSRHRPHQFAEALAVIRRHRAADTPVVIARQVGRPGETVTFATLGEMTGGMADTVDMSTLVIVGSSATRRVDRPDRSFVYTPRSHGTAPASLQGRWLLTGGARSGKSAYAERLVARSTAPVVVIATAEAFDDDMAARIARHRAERPAQWRTIEEPRDLVGALASVPGDACVLLDCITVWVGNRFHHDGVEAGARIEAAAVELAQAIAARRGPSVVVTNDVGLGLVPDTALGRRYRDTLGRVNATLAAAADRVLFLSAGRAVDLTALDRIT